MDVFISYSSKDKKIADAMCHFLEEKKIKCWIAPRDMRAGKSYASEIVKAIKNCKVFVIVFSNHSNNSKHVANEIDRAFSNEKIIIPFRIENVNLNDTFSYYLSKNHWIDAFPKPEKNFRDLEKQLLYIIKSEVSDSSILEEKEREDESEEIESIEEREKIEEINIEVENSKKEINKEEELRVKKESNFVAKEILQEKESEKETNIDYSKDKNTQNSESNEFDSNLETNQIIKGTEKSKRNKLKKIIPIVLIFGILILVIFNAIPDKKEENLVTEDKITIFEKQGLYGYKKGDSIIIKPQYLSATEFVNDSARVSFKDSVFIINSRAKWLKTVFDSVKFTEEKHLEEIKTTFLKKKLVTKKLISKKFNGKYGYINQDGKLVIPYKYDYGWDFREGLALVILNKKSGFIDKTGKIVIPLEYDHALHFFSDGLVCVKKDTKYGFIDKTGKVVIPFLYEDGFNFTEGLAMVKKNGKYGFIDKNGENIIPFQFEDTLPFGEGISNFAKVGKNGKYGLIDKKGVIIISIEYYNLYPKLNKGMISVQKQKNGKWFYINMKGVCVKDCP